MLKNLISVVFVMLLTVYSSAVFATNHEFSKWVNNFKVKAVNSGISKKVVNEVMSDVIFLPNVIKYDRFQPEFYEDTYTYIKKRTNKKKVKKGLALYKKEKLTINKIEDEFLVEKELLLALMGIETNFGNYLGKMDIVSSLATLSFDKRRSEFFTKELIILLKLVDQKIIKKEILFGSWAGAFGNFQFMPRTIRNYAIDYNKNTTIELKKTEDSFASAANYLNKIGWKINAPCFTKIELNKNIPDKDIIPGANTYEPAYLVYSNYEKILNWNRSLRFALAVCTLKNNIKNEI